MVSHVTSLDGLIILRPFDKGKIQCRQSEDSRNETKWLQNLHLETIIKYGSPTEALNAQNALNLLNRSQPRNVALVQENYISNVTRTESATSTLQDEPPGTPRASTSQLPQSFNPQQHIDIHNSDSTLAVQKRHKRSLDSTFTSHGSSGKKSTFSISFLNCMCLISVIRKISSSPASRLNLTSCCSFSPFL